MNTPLDDMIRREWVNDRIRENEHRRLVQQALGTPPRRKGALTHVGASAGRALVALGSWLVARYGQPAEAALMPSAAGTLDGC